jgi:predicted Zn-dependent peptidase
MAHPYQWPVIGWMVDIEGWKRADLSSYFKMYYAPNNATWVLVGDFDKDEVRALLKKYLEPIPRGPMPLAVTTTEPEQRGERRTEFHKTAELAAFVSSWHIPATASPDYPALRVLESLLLQGESSRLYRRLVDREQAALSVSGGFDYALDPTLFQVFVQVKEGVESKRCESLLYEEIDHLRQEGPAANEMQKAKNQLAAGFYRELQTISGKALVLGRSDVYFGDAKAFTKTVDMYEKVTSADVQRVAHTYFTPNNRTVSILIRTTRKRKKPRVPRRIRQEDSDENPDAERHRARDVLAVRRQRPRPSRRWSQAAGGRVDPGVYAHGSAEWIGPAGSRTARSAGRELPAHLKSGSIGDPAGKEGLADATLSMLRKGTTSRTAEQTPKSWTSGWHPRSRSRVRTLRRERPVPLQGRRPRARARGRHVAASALRRGSN